jgi:hypothetical protein
MKWAGKVCNVATWVAPVIMLLYLAGHVIAAVLR